MLVKVVVGNKVHQTSEKMAKAIIDMAKQKYKKENVNAIVAVRKDDIISLQKDVFDTVEELINQVEKWTQGGYKCYYTTKKG